jgi:cell division cycle 2-like protein
MTGKSRWQEGEADVDARKKEKEAKKAAKLEKQRKQDELAQKQKLKENGEPPSKRRRLSNDATEIDTKVSLLKFASKPWTPSRSVDNFERLNHIEEGSYGSVSRARDRATGQIIALKKLKIDSYQTEGIPIPAMREISTLQTTSHPNILQLHEVVLGPSPTDIYLVLPFLPHDLKALQETMPEPFLPSEVKTLMIQITSAVAYLHQNWILHRDLKTSNILLAHDGTVRLADFGMARPYSDPLPPNLTQLVVTLWYRAPELLLGTASYGAEVDIWSLGCVFGELLQNEPILAGKSEADQLSKIFALKGVPNSDVWPGWRKLPNARGLRLKELKPEIRTRFHVLTPVGLDLLSSLLSLNPDARPSAEQVLEHSFFSEAPRPKPTSMFPTFPSKASGERRRKATPEAPKRGAAPKITMEEFGGLFIAQDKTKQ